MKNVFSIGVLCLGLTSLSAMSAEQIRALPEFSAVNAELSNLLDIEVGKPQSITIKGDDKFISRVKTEVVNGELIIKSTEMSSRTTNVEEKNKIIITMPTLKRVKIEGAGKTTLTNVSGPYFEMRYEGAGMVVAQGNVEKFKLQGEGVGNLEAKNLIAKNVEVNLNGVGAASVHAKDNLNITVNGVGSLTYYGNPKNIAKSVNGIGSIKAGN